MSCIRIPGTCRDARREHGDFLHFGRPSRASTPKVQWSERYGVWKIHPLADWDERLVWGYIQVNEIPFNPLHDAG